MQMGEDPLATTDRLDTMALENIVHDTNDTEHEQQVGIEFDPSYNKHECMESCDANSTGQRCERRSEEYEESRDDVDEYADAWQELNYIERLITQG